MTSDKYTNWFLRTLIALAVFISVHLCLWLIPPAENWNNQLYDILFKIRNQIPELKPPYDNRVVHIDIDDTSTRELGTYYLNRSHYAQAIENLAKIGVTAQAYDFVFTAPADRLHDQKLIEEVKNANNVYFGYAFKTPTEANNHNNQNPLANDFFDTQELKINLADNISGFQSFDDAVLTFDELASVSKGLGFLNLSPDSDGVFRSVPLLINYNKTLYPSLPFLIICDVLQIQPVNIKIHPGRKISLQKAIPPGKHQPQDIIIPVDQQNNMVVNYGGPWGQMDHYHFSQILSASSSEEEMKIWQQELKGAIVVISDTTTGSSDLGPVPTDSSFPLSGVITNAMNTILTRSFLIEVPSFYTIALEVILLLLIVFLSYRKSTIQFILGSLSIWIIVTSGLVILFFSHGLIGNLISLLIMVVLLLFSLFFLRALLHARQLHASELSRSLFLKELEVGRKIQADFFPEYLPNIPGWQIAAQFKPARQVSGDFYDAFWLKKRQTVTLVIADVCDKGVGPALFMALIRSLVRSTLFQAEEQYYIENKEGVVESKLLLKTVTVVNDYIAETHGNTNMFATMFLGILDPKSGVLNYINCGHEPPVILGASHKLKALKPTGPAIGLFPGMAFTTKNITIAPESTLLAYTDGVVEAEDIQGNLLGKDRLVSIITHSCQQPSSLLARIEDKIKMHTAGAEQNDDITILALQHNPENNVTYDEAI